MTSEEQHTIDATDQAVGRVASQAARLLLGKHRPDAKRNEVTPVTVTIQNASKAAIRPSRYSEKKYLSYSGYPGGQTSRTMQKIVDTKGHSEVIRRAVYGMLPANRLRKPRLKRLVIEE